MSSFEELWKMRSDGNSCPVFHTWEDRKAEELPYCPPCSRPLASFMGLSPAQLPIFSAPQEFETVTLTFPAHCSPVLTDNPSAAAAF